ncbi:hypothetical protein SPRG_11562 [Saprolegnia parasitica CBS 223.65]|uniref:F-box domain-containing protein n=1 Tax=Saprolegnia parasitica (strain CBS 223.65) TaxID=695850 RepID=A0A067BWB5_SAPPC|nr:hypothetical protein SPRG_11562 [Saprolegnia parasitica CBS 223.65]KDO22804.1 hypothetical protein SPRG_11562 [Saprolegnia parasitica CBS 223.65]|eukprot:XP_012206476.1 hypothetical protein SPRG_11562 [Saprolegnia parasitica CBS 223.65]
MLPELVELIAVYIAQPYDLLRYLCAFENRLALRLPFRSLRALLSASMRTPGLRVWPELELPHDIASLHQYVCDCMELFPIVRTTSLEAHGALRPATLLSLTTLTTPDEVRTACMAPWRHRLVALELHLWDRILVDDAWTPTSLGLLGACFRLQHQLASLCLRWQLGQSQRAFEHIVLGDVLESNVLHLTLSFNDASKVIWSDAMATRLGSWLRSSRVQSLALQGLRFDSMRAATLLVDSMHALRDLRIESLQLERALCLRASLPSALRSLCIHGASVLPQWRTAASLATLALHYACPIHSRGRVWAMRPHLHRLRTLVLPNVDLENEHDREALMALLPQLTELHLDTNHLGDAGALPIIATLHRCQYLQVLSLDQQGITDVAAIALTQAHKPPSLRTLRLARNRVTCRGVTALCHVMPYLDVLDLSRNRIGGSGAKALSSVLSQTAHMRTLDVQMNMLGEAGVLALIASLRKERNLRAGVLVLSATVPRAHVRTCRAAIQSLPCPHWVILRG